MRLSFYCMIDQGALQAHAGEAMQTDKLPGRGPSRIWRLGLAAEPGPLPLEPGNVTICDRERPSYKRLVESFAAWPATAVLRPSPLLWDQLVTRIAAEPGGNARHSSATGWVEPEWEDVAPGISCKILSSDLQRDCVSMLVRLAPGTEYPPHKHAATEQLYLLDGELWIDDRKLFPGDYNSAVADTADKRVWSETGCTCLLITSLSDLLS